MLLVGGASRRFGSPKALARIGGETDHWLAQQWGMSVGVDCSSSSHSYKWNFVPKPDYHMHRLVEEVVLAAGIVRGRVGRALVTVRDNPIAAKTFGVDIATYKTRAFAISADSDSPLCATADRYSSSARRRALNRSI